MAERLEELTTEQSKYWNHMEERRKKHGRFFEASLMPFYGYAVSTNVRSHKLEQMAPLGTATHFVLRRRWEPDKFGREVVQILLAGYKAGLVDGRIVVGGPDRAEKQQFLSLKDRTPACACAYNMRFMPIPNATMSGKVLDANKRTTLDLFLDLDKEIEKVATKQRRPAKPRFPGFWVGFESDRMPEVDYTSRALQKAALSAVRLDSTSNLCPSPGGTVTAIERDDNGIYVEIGSTSPDVVVLPPTAVLRPYVREGTTIDAGIALADYVPRELYPTWKSLEEKVGAVWSRRLLERIVIMEDRQIDGLTARQLEYCPASIDLREAEEIWESFEHLLTEDGRCALQVSLTQHLVEVPSEGDFSNRLYWNFEAIRDDWRRKFNWDPLPAQTDHQKIDPSFSYEAVDASALIGEIDGNV